MRVKFNRVKWYPVYRTTYKRDKEANTSEEFEFQGLIPCIVYGNQGTISTESYGLKLNYTKSAKVDRSYKPFKDIKGITHYEHECGCVLTENDVICIDIDIPEETVLAVGDKLAKDNEALLTIVSENHMTPDHKIKSIKAERYLMLEMEKL